MEGLQRGTRSAVATILVTDGTERSALAACRSLTRAGHEVHTAAARRWSLAGVSRRVCEHLVAEDAMVRPDAFAAAIMALAARVHADVLLPMTDASATAILSQPAGAPLPCRVLLPPFPAFQLASDKAALLPLAERAGFAIPESTLISSRAAALTLSLDGLVPGVLKPQRSIAVVGAGLRRHGVVPFATAAEGATRLRSMPDEAFPILVQRRVDGPGVGFFALRWRGRIVATFAHRRVRSPPFRRRQRVPRIDPASAQAGCSGDAAPDRARLGRRRHGRVQARRAERPLLRDRDQPAILGLAAVGDRRRRGLSRVARGVLAREVSTSRHELRRRDTEPLGLGRGGLRVSPH